MRSLIGMTFLNSSVGQRRLRQNGIVLRLGRVVADRRRAALPHRQGRCLDRQGLETLLLWLQRHFLCVPLEHLLESPAPACLRIALSVDGNPAELAELVYPLLERYEMPASAFIGGDPRSWREAVADTLWQADAAAAEPLLELLERYGGAALMRVLERTGDDQRRSRSLDLLLRKLERLDPASQQALRAACTAPRRTARAIGNGSAAWKTAAWFASACTARTRTQRQAFAPRTVSAAPTASSSSIAPPLCRCSAKLAPRPPRRLRNPACAPPSAGLATASPSARAMAWWIPVATRWTCRASRWTRRSPPVPAGWPGASIVEPVHEHGL